VYPEVSGLAAWGENCKWYGSLPLGAVVSLFVSQSSEFYCHNPLRCFSTSVYCCKRIFRYRLSPENFGYILVYLVFESIMGVTRNANNILVGKPEGREPLEGRRRRMRADT
jgi:hypothetical protein